MLAPNATQKRIRGKLRHYLLGGLLATLVVGGVSELITSLIANNQIERQRVETLDKLATLRARLEGEINSTLHLTRGMIAYVATHPAVGENDFSELASEIVSVGRHIRNIGLARNNIITHIYPLAGNEAALGLDYAKVPSQWPMVKKAIDQKGTVVAGPVNLVQGGEAFIARTPIYTRQSNTGLLSRHKPEYWGMASIVIDIPQLFQAAGIRDGYEGIHIAIRGKDGRGEEGALIFGSLELFSTNPVLQSVLLPNGSWQLAAVPRGGWGGNSALLWLLRITGWVIALVIGGLIGALLWARSVHLRLALHDHLTGLPNRRLLEDRLEQLIVRNLRDDSSFCLFYIDLDGFKLVNDRYGHKVGDGLLIEVSKRLLGSVRAMDTVARIGGDEFIVLVDRLGNKRDMLKVGDNLRRGLTGEVYVENRHLEIHASIGMASFPEDGRSIDELLKSGDQKMYMAKQRSRVHAVDFSSQA